MKYAIGIMYSLASKMRAKKFDYPRELDAPIKEIK